MVLTASDVDSLDAEIRNINKEKVNAGIQDANIKGRLGMKGGMNKGPSQGKARVRAFPALRRPVPLWNILREGRRGESRFFFPTATHSFGVNLVKRRPLLPSAEDK